MLEKKKPGSDEPGQVTGLGEPVRAEEVNWLSGWRVQKRLRSALLAVAMCGERRLWSVLQALQQCLKTVLRLFRGTNGIAQGSNGFTLVYATKLNGVLLRRFRRYIFSGRCFAVLNCGL